MFKINVWSFCVLVMPYTLKGHKKVLLVLFSNEIACASSFMIVICANFVFILLPVFREDLQNLGIVASFGETRALAPKIFFWTIICFLVQQYKYIGGGQYFLCQVS